MLVKTGLSDEKTRACIWNWPSSFGKGEQKAKVMKTLIFSCVKKVYVKCLDVLILRFESVDVKL